MTLSQQRDFMGAPAGPSATIERIVREIRAHAFAFHDERELHDGIAQVLDFARMHYEREYIATPRDRFDFLCAGDVVIEAKIKGSFAEALRQCSRYCELPEVAAVVLVTTRHWGRTESIGPDERFHGKQIVMVQARGQAF